MSMSFFFFSSRRRHTRLVSDWSSDVCSSDLLRAREDRGTGGHDCQGETRETEPPYCRTRDDTTRHETTLRVSDRLKNSRKLAKAKLRIFGLSFGFVSPGGDKFRAHLFKKVYF